MEQLPERRYSLDCICIPLPLLRVRELSERAMLLFGMISRHIGDHEAGRVFLTEIASDLGISIDTASRELNRLEGSGVLGHKRTGRENEYFHTWHPMLVNGLLPVHLDLATLSLGERYNAYRRFLFILVPLALIKWRRISYGATLLFGLLCFHGRNGSCYVGDEKLAAELGTSVARVRRWRRELQRAGLIEYDATRSGTNTIFQIIRF